MIEIVNNFDAFFFDMDGVLLDSEPLHDKVFDVILQKYGCEISIELRNKFVGTSSRSLCEALKNEYDLPMTVDELIDLQWKTIIEMLPNSGIGASDGLYELLEYLKKQGKIVAIVSSSRADFIEVVIKHLKIEDKVDFVVNGFQVINGKPAPDIYLLASRNCKVEPSDCAVIEDSTNGIRSGKNAGMTVIGYNNPTSGNQDISSADYMVNSLRDILKLRINENK